MPVMRKQTILWGCCFIMCVLAVQAQSNDDAIPLKASDKDLEWFRDAKFGLFVTWGPVSLIGKSSWARSERCLYEEQGWDSVPADEYDQLYKRFNPINYDARQWVKIAEDAGAKYLVFITKHHDGFSNFHTQYSDYEIGKTPFKRDIVKELAEACHESELKLGLYYSQRDWYHPNYLKEHHDRYLKFMHGQVRELCTNYGKVDILWFDSISRHLKDWKSEELIRMIRRLQPGILINNRVASILAEYDKTPEPLQGDFDTPEHKIGSFQKTRAWESCMTLVGADHFFWSPGGKMKTLKECIDILVTCVGGDGNLLLDVGPMPDGRIEPRQVKRLQEIGRWLAQYGEAIYGTRGGPVLPGEWGACTYRGNVVYVHVLQETELPILLPRLPGNIVSSHVLTGGTVRVSQQPDGISLDVNRLDSLDTIIKLRLDAPIPDNYVSLP